ncbi:MAG: hypothetical protein WA416_13030 [Candidatus Sulfotelmatobacter sp.]
MRKLALTLTAFFLLPVVLLAGKNPADYPLQIQIIESHWHRHRDGSVDGWGRGDIKDGDSIHAFDFSYESLAPFQRTIGDAHYLAKWKKEQLKLEMLVGEIGSPDKFHTYDLKTSVREDVYIPSASGAVAVSQAEYKAKQQP